MIPYKLTRAGVVALIVAQASKARTEDGDLPICDGCSQGVTSVETCWHGRSLCVDCAHDGLCLDCVKEARRG